METLGITQLPLSEIEVEQYPAYREKYHPAESTDCLVIEKTLPEQFPFQAKLPGMDGQPEDCGLPVAVHCNNCGTSFWTASSCKERGCPVCYEKWAWKESGVASRRIWLYRDSLKKEGIHCRIVHCVVSLKYTDQTFNELKVQARRVCRKKGITGDMAIYHQWREESGQWVNDKTVHFHVIGIALGNIKPGSVEDETEGILFKVVKNPTTPDRPYGGITKVIDLRRLISYQLSHCSIIEKKHTVVWSGCLAYNKWSQAKVDEFPTGPAGGYCCPVCHSFDTESCDAHWQYGDDDWHVGRIETVRVHDYPVELRPNRLIAVIRWVAPSPSP